MREFVTPAELAKVLKCSERHVRALCARGEMPGAVRLGTIWRICVEDFDAARRRAAMRPVEAPQESPAELGHRLYPSRRRR